MSSLQTSIGRQIQLIWRPAAAAILWMLMASAMIVETDAYRYVTVVLVMVGLVGSNRQVRLVSQDWLALLCYGWAIYALARFIYGLVVWGEKGTSEWLYIFPLFFPLVGVTLYATRRYLYGASTFFLAVALLAFLFTLDMPGLYSGARAAPLFHKNPIHAGVGCGMILICSVFWLLYSYETGRLRGLSKWPKIALGLATAVASIIGALGAQSKGVWLALAGTMVFLAIAVLFCGSTRWRVALLGMALASLAIAALAYPYVERVAGATAGALADLMTLATTTESISDAVKHSIESPNTPNSTAARLKLIYNALELLNKSPWVGFGNLWVNEWQKRTYTDVEFMLLHNGYLEILVRHGVLGITMLLVFSVEAARRVSTACRAGQLSISITYFLLGICIFFFSTILTNSNNRLAIGESFFIVMGAVVFALSLGRKELPPVNTGLSR